MRGVCIFFQWHQDILFLQIIGRPLCDVIVLVKAVCVFTCFVLLDATYHTSFFAFYRVYIALIVLNRIDKGFFFVGEITAGRTLGN